MNVTLLRRPRILVLLIPFVIICTTILYFAFQYQYQIKNTISYATRPLWDKAEGPSQIVPHYHADGLSVDEHTCKLHGWSKRVEDDPIRVLDAVLMSSELDLLKIRMQELDPIVDYFLVLESNATFTGLHKETYFAANRERYSNFEHKIVYKFLPGYSLQPGQSAWDVESDTRNAMTDLIRSHIQTFPTDTKSLVIMSDVDEIPSQHTIELLRACQFGESIHLQLRNYLYSFEWYLGPSSWRASVHEWTGRSFYRHSKSSNIALADSGWHCSYCFRTIAEYVIKMKGFSHSDRIGGRIALLEPTRIQKIICEGKDIFGMLPEAYSYLDMFSQLSLEPQKSGIGLPRYLLENAEKFRFLLPGGCQRPS